MTPPNYTELVCLHNCNCEYCTSDLAYKCMHCDHLVISKDLNEFIECDCALSDKVMQERACLAATVLDYKECLTDEYESETDD